ncbi:MAG: class I SAM-dependent methyltransferase [Eubacteriales bacterium]|nr:class I SAM-dependent methyltransferase [Eubacteriales bacterium]
MKNVHLRPRLLAAAQRMEGETAADIGCDHGRLCVWLLQQRRAAQAVGTDISEASLGKAKSLRALCGLEDAFALRAGNGLSVLRPGEADTLFFCGMGGELIARMLADGAAVARAARRIVMQPMRGTAELRAYLYANAYAICDEQLVFDAGRYYQIIAAYSGTPRPLPPGFPAEHYTFGALSFTKRDPLLLPMLQAYRDGHMRRLEKARAKGQNPAQLREICEETDALIALAKEMNP